MFKEIEDGYIFEVIPASGSFLFDLNMDMDSSVLDDSPKLDNISTNRRGRPPRSKNNSANKNLGDAPSCPSMSVEDASQTPLQCVLMNCLSWNVRGLESLDRKYVVKRVLNSFNYVDLFMMQEIKATGFMLDISLNFIWKDAIKFYSSHIKGKGGIVVLVNPKWGKLITNNDVSPYQRTV